MMLDPGLNSFKQVVAAAAAVACLALAPPSSASMIPGRTPAAEISRNAQSALQKLYAAVPAAKAIGKQAHAVLVFPGITKVGLGVGAQYGEGAMIKGDKVVAYYSTSGASYGLQAGAQTYGYAMFFMNEASLKQLDKSEGFEVGVGPSVVVLDEGKAKTLTTTTMNDDVYAFIFSQQGLMAGLGVQGNKITKISPK